MKNAITKGLFALMLAGSLTFGIGACKKEFTHDKNVKTEYVGEEQLKEKIDSNQYVIYQEQSVFEEKIKSARIILKESDTSVQYINADGDYVSSHKHRGEYVDVFFIKGFDIISKEKDTIFDEKYQKVFKTSKEYYLARSGVDWYLLDGDGKKIVKGNDFLLKEGDTIYTCNSDYVYKIKLLDWEERMEDKK